MIDLPYISERYDAVAILGTGGFAVVYRVYDRTLDRHVAMKVLKSSVSDNPSTRRRFLEEARRIARLNHPNIVTVHEVGELSAGPYLTMELIDGVTVAGLVQRDGPLSLERATEVLSGLVAAVDHLHERRVVHRDISAANVMLGMRNRVVLMDFGIARALDGTQYTQPGAILGTPEAMSPEQVRGHEAGPAADIYALGVLAYRLLAGRPPFSGDPIQVMHGHAFEDARPLRSVRPGLPDRVYDAIDAALQKEAPKRPGSAGQFLAALIGVAPEPYLSLDAVSAADETVDAGAGPVVDAKTAIVLGAPTAAISHLAGTAISRVPFAHREPYATRWWIGAAAAVAVALAAGYVSIRSLQHGSRSVSHSSPIRLAAQIPDRDLLRPGAHTVQRFNLAGAGGATAVALHSESASSTGCTQPHIDVFHLDAGGKWEAIWDSHRVPSAKPLIDGTEGDGCSATVTMFEMRADPQEGDLLFAAAKYADGSQRITALRWDGLANDVSVLYETQTAPVADVNLEGNPRLHLRVIENAYPPASSGLRPDYSEPIGRLNETLELQGSGFVVDQALLTPNCTAGKLSLVSPASTGVLIACADGGAGPKAAASITPDTVLADGIESADLVAGDDITLTYAPASLSMADPLAALPVAETLVSASALTRRQERAAAAGAPTVSASPSPVASRPLASPAQAPAPRLAQPPVLQSAPSQAAPQQVAPVRSAPAPATPRAIPVQPIAPSLPRAIPQQP